MMKRLLYMLLAVFWLEAVMTLLQGFWSMMNPTSWLTTILDLDPSLEQHVAIARPAIAHLLLLITEVVRWYGVVCIVLALALMQSVNANLFSHTATTREYLSKLLMLLALGDLLQMGCCARLWHMAHSLGKTNLMSMVITVVVFVSRCAWFANNISEKAAGEPQPSPTPKARTVRHTTLKQL